MENEEESAIGSLTSDIVQIKGPEPSLRVSEAWNNQITTFLNRSHAGCNQLREVKSWVYGKL